MERRYEFKKYFIFFAVTTSLISFSSAAIVFNSSEAVNFNISGSQEYNFNDTALNLQGNRITNFFNQTACADDEAIKTIYPNGSYACNPLSQTSSAENLSETLNAGSKAFDNINMTGYNITNANTIRFQDAGGNILNVDKLSLSQGNTDYKLRVGGEKFLDDGFEDGTLSPFQNDPDDDVSSSNQVNWSTTSNTPFGSYAANATDTGDDEVAEMETTVSDGTLVVFKYYLDTEDPSYDEAYVETQSGKSKKLVNTSESWQTASLEVGPGSTELEFVLRGGTFGGSYSTDFRVDEVRVFNTTENAVSVYGSQTLNTGSLNQVDRINFVEGIDVGQSSNASETVDVAVGRGAEAASSVSGGSETAFGSDSSASGFEASAFGSDSSASATEASAFGHGSSASALYASAFGYSSSASAQYASAFGHGSSASALYASAFGYGSSASASEASAFGLGSSASADGSITLGYNAGQDSTEGLYSVVLGSDPDGSFSSGSEATGDYSMALGPDASATANGAVAIGYKAKAPDQYEATFGNLNGEELDVNVTGNLTVHGSDGLDLKGGKLQNVGSIPKCGAAQYLTGDGDCRDDQTNPPQNLSETLSNGNGFGDYDMNTMGQNITSNTGNVTIGTDLKVYGSIWQPGNKSQNDINLTDVLAAGNRANMSINMDGNSLENYFNQVECGGSEAVKQIYPNGSYVCESIRKAEKAFTLKETLAAGNRANRSIVMLDNRISGAEWLEFSSDSDPHVVYNSTAGAFTLRDQINGKVFQVRGQEVDFKRSVNISKDLNVTDDLRVKQRFATGSNTVSNLNKGDINASTIYYDTLTAKSPVVQCSAGSDWCEVSVPENQSSFFVKKGESFDKDRPRETAEKVVEMDLDTAEKLEELKRENRRQEEKIERLNETVQGLKSIVCEDSRAEVCG